MRAPTSALLTLAAITAASLLTACTTTTTGGPATTANPTVGITTHSVVTSGAGSTPTNAPTTPPATTAAAAAGPILKITGNGIKNTKQFTTADNWTINYTYNCTGTYGGNGNFQVYVDYPNGDVPVNELGSKGSSSSAETGAGVHSLKVVSECPWTLTVTDG